ncbi:hypothetical protein [Mycobacterium sp. 94-17]|uniref:hypothetical protein n=1 Tax=Mycobacterium sp. 94-17 TaxID=2986147 RepID=UPI002D1EC725|nr:hypothetical protein [Mycobacterium sp. 94-17]
MTLCDKSYATTGTETPAFWAITISCVAATFLTWARYVRPRHCARPPAREAHEATVGQCVSS